MKFALVFIFGATALMCIAMRYEAEIFYWLSGWVACRGWMSFVEHIITPPSTDGVKWTQPMVDDMKRRAEEIKFPDDADGVPRNEGEHG